MDAIGIEKMLLDNCLRGLLWLVLHDWWKACVKFSKVMKEGNAHNWWQILNERKKIICYPVRTWDDMKMHLHEKCLPPDNKPPCLINSSRCAKKHSPLKTNEEVQWFDNQVSSQGEWVDSSTDWVLRLDVKREHLKEAYQLALKVEQLQKQPIGKQLKLRNLTSMVQRHQPFFTLFCRTIYNSFSFNQFFH